MKQEGGGHGSLRDTWRNVYDSHPPFTTTVSPDKKDKEVTEKVPILQFYSIILMSILKTKNTSTKKIHIFQKMNPRNNLDPPLLDGRTRRRET